MNQFYLYALSVGTMLAGVLGLLVMGPAPESRPTLMDVSEYRVIGQGCGVGSQKLRTYIAVEEDNLPGPTCEVVSQLGAVD